MTRVFPVERRVVKALRPVLSRAAGVPMPEDDVFAALERLHAELDQVRTLLTGRDASVRLVLTPEQVVLAEARRSYTTLSLFGYRVDGVVANRVFPADDADPWRAGWVAAQAERPGSRWRSPSPTSRCGTRSTGPREPVGLEALADFGRAGVRRPRPARRTGRARAVPDHPHQRRRRAATCGCPSSTAVTSTSPGTATIWS